MFVVIQLSYGLHLKHLKSVHEKDLVFFSRIELATTSPEGSPSAMKGMNSLMTLYVAKDCSDD